MEKLKLRKSLKRRIDVDGILFDIDYLTNEQETFLMDLMVSDVFIENNGKKIIFNDILKNKKYGEYYIKFCIKGWDENQFGEKCIIIDNELEDDLWHEIIKDYKRMLRLFGAFNEELKFTDTDKKKLQSEESS